MEKLSAYLEDLESRIDDETETALYRQWVDFTEGRWKGGVFAPRRPVPRPPRLEWPFIPINTAIADLELMLLHQLAQCSRILAAGKGELLCIRANYGMSLVPSMYGTELFMMPEEMDTLPTCRPLPGGLDGVLRRLDSGGPDLEGGLGAGVLRAGVYFRDLLKDYPGIARHVAIYHPDLQGPMDACELLVGSAVFTELIDRPDEIHRVLQSLTRTYRLFTARWRDIIPPTDRWTVHWGMLLRGQIMLRDDSATNLSPAMFDKFVRPYDAELLAALGGGAMHFCGRGDLFVHAAATIPHLHAIHMSQPELNDVEKVCAHTIDRGINLIGLKHEAGEKLVQQGRPLRGRVHCWEGIPK